jgi:peptidoglycan/xylan/chitin deacetylase (PgdA/CDA1 family)
VNAVRVAASLALLAGGFFALYEAVESPRSDAFAPVITHGAGRVVALTFDDGPTRGVTDRVLDVLEREHVPATFFVVGSAARREPALLRRMIADGDEVENHSDTHAHLNALTPTAIDGEIARTDDAVYAATGRHTSYLRPPFGARNAAVIEAARARGMRVVLWSAMLDETSPNAAADALVRRLLEQPGDGAIVVLHDGDRGRGSAGGRAYEAALTPRVIAELRARGYRFATLDGLLRGSS